MTRRWCLLALAALAPSFGACGYLSRRAYDFGDVFRLEFSTGPGLEVDAGVGEFVHLGLGSQMGGRAGWQYGHLFQGGILEHYLPFSLVESFRVPGYEGLHLISWDYEQPPQHQCYLLFPHGLGRSTARRDDFHAFDLEAGAHAILIGVHAGISPGELIDFLLGWWGFDLAEDDSDFERGNKRLYRFSETRPGAPPR